MSKYREHLPLQRLRPLREWLRVELGTSFPFAVAQPMVAPDELVWGKQQELGIPETLWIVVGSGQLMLSAAAESFCKRVRFDPETRRSGRLHPNGGSA